MTTKITIIYNSSLLFFPKKFQLDKSVHFLTFERWHCRQKKETDIADNILDISPKHDSRTCIQTCFGPTPTRSPTPTRIVLLWSNQSNFFSNANSNTNYPHQSNKLHFVALVWSWSCPQNLVITQLQLQSWFGLFNNSNSNSNSNSTPLALVFQHPTPTPSPKQQFLLLWLDTCSRVVVLNSRLLTK